VSKKSGREGTVSPVSVTCRGAVAGSISDQDIVGGFCRSQSAGHCRVLSERFIFASNGLLRQASRMIKPSCRALLTCRLTDLRLTASLSTSASLRNSASVGISQFFSSGFHPMTGIKYDCHHGSFCGTAKLDQCLSHVGGGRVV
jgi:hypothetical protein